MIPAIKIITIIEIEPINVHKKKTSDLTKVADPAWLLSEADPAINAITKGKFTLIH